MVDGELLLRSLKSFRETCNHKFYRPQREWLPILAAQKHLRDVKHLTEAHINEDGIPSHLRFLIRLI